MLTSQDVNTINAALKLSVASGTILQSQMDAIVDKLIAMLPTTPTPALGCTRCGRLEGNPANANCDMQPCHFV